MVRVKIREFDAKRIISQNIPHYGSISIPFWGLLVTLESDWDSLVKEYPWLSQQRLVIKPDQLFGKRKQYGLVLVDVTLSQVKEFVNRHGNKEMMIGKVKGKLTHFLVEPFIPHQEEYYLSIVSHREGEILSFSLEGGADIEERWSKVHSLFIPTLQVVDIPFIKQNFSHHLPHPPQRIIISVMTALFNLYRGLHFSYLEINPFTLDEMETVHILDAVAHVDDFAVFEVGKKWGDVPFPKPFGRQSYPEEKYIADLDKDSGASLKLTVLNSQGKIWNILSGGGASILILDALVKYGNDALIANYGEYSGNPTTEESYHYAKTILDLMTREVNPQGKILLIAGAVANFTDVEKTFLGINRALQKYREKLKMGKVSIYIRRGGPNYEKGLELIAHTGKQLRIPMEVYGPETALTFIVERVDQQLRGGEKTR